MRVPLVYVALAISSLSYGPLRVAAAYYCWAPSSGVSANYGPLSDLRIDATAFCQKFASNTTAIVSGSGKYIFGWQSAMFVGNFASSTSCLDTFNTLVTECYGTAYPTRPLTLGGSIVDPGGANLVISFGDGAQL